jgi:hypothetical protein
VITIARRSPSEVPDSAVRCGNSRASRLLRLSGTCSVVAPSDTISSPVAACVIPIGSSAKPLRSVSRPASASPFSKNAAPTTGSPVARRATWTSVASGVTCVCTASACSSPGVTRVSGVRDALIHDGYCTGFAPNAGSSSTSDRM